MRRIYDFRTLDLALEPFENGVAFGVPIGPGTWKALRDAGDRLGVEAPTLSRH
jgi:hypothetical protein